MSTDDGSRLRVAIVDDSAYVRYVLKTRLESLGAEVVATFARGEPAIDQVPDLNPDVVTMDVLMPGLGGIETVRQLRNRWPGTIIMVSSQTCEGAAATWDALDAGADDFVAKPTPPYPLDSVMEMIVAKAYALIRPRTAFRSRIHDLRRPERVMPGSGHDAFQAMVIGASTGGPRALATVLGALRAPPRIPLLIVQHMPAGFTASFAERLTGQLGFGVQEVPPDGTSIPLLSSSVVLATGGRHLRVSAHRCWSEPGTRLHGVIPAVDVTLLDALESFGSRLGVVILTGMGEDGCRGAIQAHQRGAWVVAEAQETAVVWGMPGAVVQAGAADAVWPLNQIGLWLNDTVTGAVDGD